MWPRKVLKQTNKQNFCHSADVTQKSFETNKQTKIFHSADVIQGNVMVAGKPVCDDNWGMEEVLNTHVA